VAAAEALALLPVASMTLRAYSPDAMAQSFQTMMRASKILKSSPCIYAGLIPEPRKISGAVVPVDD
jgi:hypothetical protein